MNDKDKNNTLGVYALLIFSSVLLCIPNTLLASIGALSWILTLLLSWMLRFRKPKDGILYQHMLYITRTIWNGVFIAGITGLIAMIYVAMNADHSIYQSAISDMSNGVSYSEEMMIDAFNQYIRVNFGTIVVAGILYFGLPTAYTIYRIYRGINYTLKNIPQPEFKKWL